MRAWIYKALCAVLLRNTYSNLYLKVHLQEVEKANQALCTRIFYGTIQNYRYCEYMWQTFAKGKVDPKIGILLSMSVYQLKFLDRVPQYAIVNDAVNIAKKINLRASRMVNAILHKVIEADIAYPEDPIEALSIETSIQPWLLKMWKAQYGQERMKAMAHFSNQILPILVRRNPLKITREDLIQAGYEPMEDLFIYSGNDLAKNSYYLQGMISAQDHGSFEIAKALDVKPGMKVLDTCAAPGTKSMALAEQMKNQGLIHSLDLHAHRVQLIQSDANRLGLDIVNPLCQDATQLTNFDLYDRILCDVPCTGYGVFSRKPDIKYHMKPEDMDALIPISYAILDQASKHLKPQGILVFSTCTINKKENEKQIEKFLKEHPNFELLEEKTMFPQVNYDGFYYAKVSKK